MHSMSVGWMDGGVGITYVNMVGHIFILTGLWMVVVEQDEVELCYPYSRHHLPDGIVYSKGMEKK